MIQGVGKAFVFALVASVGAAIGRALVMSFIPSHAYNKDSRPQNKPRPMVSTYACPDCGCIESVFTDGRMEETRGARSQAIPRSQTDQGLGSPVGGRGLSGIRNQLRGQRPEAG